MALSLYPSAPICLANSGVVGAPPIITFTFSRTPDSFKAAITKEAIEENVDPQYVINEYMVKAMEEIGSRFEAGRAFVPELLMAARAMKGSLELLKPQLAGNHSRPIAKIIIGTVKGDLHDIGKNLVASMFEGCGFEVINLGTDVSAKKFVDAVCEYHADILCMSALLTTTMNYMREVIATATGNFPVRIAVYKSFKFAILILVFLVIFIKCIIE